MTTQSIRAVSTNSPISGLFDEFVRGARALSAGQRAARDWRRLSARGRGASREDVAREVFERNFS